MTSLAVLADIHGNSVALQAVLDDLNAQGGADYIISLGDLAVFGPDPVGVINILRNYEPIFHVMGNTDRYLVEKQYPVESGKYNWEAQVLASFPWTASQLSPSHLQFLADLPRLQLLFFSPKHAILAVHGSPRSDEENIRPDTPDVDLYQMLPESSAYNLILCGHTHLPLNRMLEGRHIVNVGSVGLPFDGCPHASYVLIQLRPGGHYRIEFRRVAYDIEKVVNQLFAAGHPAAEVQVYNLRSARPIGDKLIYTEEMRQGHRL
ncbi:MAG: hypothetical protein DPW09_01805 [Anaerolineae bacterium]|nr:metallophosphoesterase family protein [Anaerolineales bacterium]MCQ3972162.1 hypothetical protein [Anaerolineae bacterium]